MGKTYCIGDIHANYKGLIQAIDRSPYKIHEDRLILLGDLVDGGPDSAEVIDYLADLKSQYTDIMLVKGNHDEWFKHWLTYGVNPVNWLQGQKATAESYIKFIYNKDKTVRTIIPDGLGAYKSNLTTIDIPQSHIDFLNSGVDYHVDEDGNLYVHGGFNRHLPIDEQHFDDIYYWDRDLWSQALSYGAITDPESALKFKMKDSFNKIFIGHTTTLNWGKMEPMKAANIINLDTGAGFKGKVTIYCVDDDTYVQSDTVKELYGNDFHR